MKIKSFLVAIMSLCSLVNATAENKFFIEDFSIEAGETKEIEICLTNDVAFTGFQADIFLPEGLTFLEEDGEYIFDLSDRKHRSHTISAAKQADGSIRLLSYSTTSKEYSGNEGVLVYCEIIASEDFSGTHEIVFDNVKFAQSTGVEIMFDSTTTKVTGPTVEPENQEVLLTVKDAEQGQISLMVETGASVKLKFETETEWYISTVLFNDVDVTDQLDVNGVFVIPELTENSIINVTYTQETTSVASMLTSDVKVYGYNGCVNVLGTTEGDSIEVFNVDGKLIKTENVSSEITTLYLPSDLVYFVKCNNSSYKVKI